MGLGQVGIRVEIEPCGDPAYLAVKHRLPLSSTWEVTGKVEAGGEPAQLPIPGLSGPLNSGAFIDISITGNADDMSVNVFLSLCVLGACNDGVFGLPYLGWPAAGIPVLKFDDLKFVDKCPAKNDEGTAVTIAVIIGAIAGVLAIVGLVVLVQKGTPDDPNARL